MPTGSASAPQAAARSGWPPRTSRSGARSSSTPASRPGPRADPVLSQRLLLALPEIVGSLFLLLILALLLVMARTLRAGDVFVPVNARRLSVVGLTVLAQAVLAPILSALTAEMLVSATLMAEQVPFAVTFTGEYVLLAFLILALGEVFRRGTKLRADADTDGLV
ncbi:DUF2975 domain-containing protein [Streptomyces sp. D2-8]|nr:DUF2975 domain-containing protein [Streptomyces sp. D2-8]